MGLKPTDVINKLIAADDLYWNDTENKYVALSPEDISGLVDVAVENGLVSESDIMNVFHWATNVRIGEILLRNFLAGRISIDSFTETGEPLFSPSVNGNI